MPGGVAIEHIDNALGKAGERLHVMFRQRRTQRSHDVINPRLPTGDAIGITLHNDGGILCDDKLLGPVKAIKVALLMEHTRLGGVEIFWLTVAHNATAKSDVVTLLIKDGKHHAVVKTIGELSAPAAHSHVGVNHLLRSKALLRQMCYQHIAARRKAQRIAAADVTAHTTAGKVLTRTAVLTAHKHGVIELGGLGAQVVDAGALGAALTTGTGVVKLNAGAIGQIADRLGKAQVLALHNVSEDVAALTAAKTVPHLCGGNDVERRRLFAVEGAAPPKLMTARLELDGLLHNGNQVGCSTHLVFFLVANHKYSPPAHPSYGGYRQCYPRLSRSTHPKNQTRAKGAANA